MQLNLKRVSGLLRECLFTNLFVEELGWNQCDLSPIKVPVDGADYTLTAISEMGGLVALQCGSPTEDSIPDYHVRRKIDRLVSKLHYEHIIVYCDSRQQVWQWVKKESGQPAASREHHFYYDQSGLPLMQKLDGLVFSMDELDEDGNVSIKAVSDRVKSALDVDKVTKRFFDRFKDELNAFKGFIKGITNEARTDWYSSLMLNRLMFIYFIQKKGFLDRNTDYMRDRLQMVQEQRGHNRFFSFYRSFLRVLFHEGLNSRERTDELVQLIGAVPYLDGGLFEEHEIEKESPNLDIPDDAFERLFGFFDQYEWHLDTRPLRNDREINPDVLGYIFEKYINAIQPGEQKAKGAYYTKEDITGYIAQNTIIPYLFDAARQKCAIAFEGETSVWNRLCETPNSYIYPAVKLGVIDRDGNVMPESALPDFVQIGMHDPEARMFDRRYNLTEADLRDADGNKLTLPTETWREYVERRKRCLEIRSKLQEDEVRSIDDLVTLNLDIRQFAQDVIENTESPDLLRSFWEVLRKITVLDPTCGSGAFLFAALNILEPLYEGCLGRMREFLEVWSYMGKQAHPNYSKWFAETLSLVEEHPARYFIFKSIILNNLYGVDIMPEAVEICKLRLFLKLAAEVDPDPSKPNMGLDPLPDIDFNIRAGNTLVGFATEEETERTVQGKLDFDDAWSVIEDKIRGVSELMELFRCQQTELGQEVTTEDKADLRARLAAVDEELNEYLAKEYGDAAKDHVAWVKSHQPFHWFVEFHGIMKGGGFDVIIGNPPYVEYKDVCGSYGISNYSTMDCSNLFAFVLEQCTICSHQDSRTGMIVPLSAFCTDRMIPLIKRLKQCSSMIHIANFSWRPGKLFDGVNLQLSIVLQKVGSIPSTFTTRYILWDSEARSDLFSKVHYQQVIDFALAGSIPKIGSAEACAILQKLRRSNASIARCLARPTIGESMFYRRGGLYWKVFVDFQTGSSEEKILTLNSDVDRHAVIAALSSSLWFWYFIATSDCRHLGNRDISTFPFDPRVMDTQFQDSLSKLGLRYVDHLRRNAVDAVRVYKGIKEVECISFRVKESKPIIDEIDQLLAKHYGFTDEELDFIINYDIKYRMGINGGEEEE